MIAKRFASVGVRSKAEDKANTSAYVRSLLQGADQCILYAKSATAGTFERSALLVHALSWKRDRVRKILGRRPGIIRSGPVSGAAGGVVWRGARSTGVMEVVDGQEAAPEPALALTCPGLPAWLMG